MRLKMLCLLVLAYVFIGHTPILHAQTVPDSDVKYSWPFVTLSTFPLEKHNADGTVKILGYQTQSEGQHLLILGDSQTNATHLIHCEVTDIGETGTTIKVRPKALAALNSGRSYVQLVRPLAGYWKPGVTRTMVKASTTAELKTMPDIIPIAGATAAQAPKTPAVAPSNPFAAIGAARSAAMRAQSTNNLKQIMLAFHNYHSSYNAFPPAVVYGPDGKPWHSWRVLILGFLEHGDIYNAYNFSEPWDSPANKKLIDKMPSVYRDPVYQDAKTTFTNYAVVVGPKTMFPAKGIKMNGAKLTEFAGPVGLRNITDGTSNSIAVVPVSPDRKIPWTKPEDISMTESFPGLGKPGGIAAPYPTADGKAHIAPIAFADGSVYSFKDTIAPNIMEALLTIGGGEVIDRTKLDTDSPTTARGGFAQPKMKMLKITKNGTTFKAVVEE